MKKVSDGDEKIWVQFLLERGVEAGISPTHGETGLHWAAFAGHAEIVELLLAANAPVNATEQDHGGTPLGWAVYGWNNPVPEFRNARYHEVAERLIRAGAVVDWEWIESPRRGSSLGAKLREDSRMMAALGIEK